MKLKFAEFQFQNAKMKVYFGKNEFDFGEMNVDFGIMKVDFAKIDIGSGHININSVYPIFTRKTNYHESVCLR